MAKKKVSKKEMREAERQKKLEMLKAKNSENEQAESQSAGAPEVQEIKKEDRTKSNVKAAGLKSAFAVSEDVYLTSFGKGNSAELEANIKSDNSVSKLSTAGKLPDITATDFHITMKSSLIKAPVTTDNPTNNKTLNRKYPRKDMLNLKPVLENTYFGREFDDNIHIQVIHNILDIEKILALYSNNVVFTINNILRISGSEDDDFIGIGYLHSRNNYDEYLHPENYPEKFTPNIKDNVDASRATFNESVLNNPRLAYFGNAFYKQNNKRYEKKDDKIIYHVLALISSIRQSCFHGKDFENHYWLYDFENSEDLDREYLDTIDLFYSEMLDRVNKNFIKTNSVNISIAADVLRDMSNEEIIEKYYDFTVRKSYKNLGFSIKKLREKMFELPGAGEFKSDDYASVRHKLYKLIDFRISCYYDRESDRVDDMVSRLRSSVTAEAKEEIYRSEAEYLWEDCESDFRNILKEMNGQSIKDRKNIMNTVNKNFDISRFTVNDNATYFAKLIYILTFFLDGKEINDMLTTLINKFDNIASLLDVMNKLDIPCGFANEFRMFGSSKKIVSDLKLINNFARMQKPIPAAKSIMYRDALDILGIPPQMSEAAVDEKIKDILDKKHGTGFRNFIASNVIESSRFQYLVRYCNSKKIHEMAQNTVVTEFVLKRLPASQIDRYYKSCTGNEPNCFTEEDKLRYLTGLIRDIRFDAFENVRQNDRARNVTREEKLEKQKYQAMISVYLTIMYLTVKNLININSRYVIGFHCLERDSFYYFKSDPDHYEVLRRILKKRDNDYRMLTKALYEEGENSKSHYLANNRKFRETQNKNIERTQEFLFEEEYTDNRGRSRRRTYDLINEYRNCVCHLSAVRNANEYIDDIREVSSYFALYHYLIQKTLIKRCRERVPEADHEFFTKLSRYRTYVKDMVKALNVPFGYNIPRYNNLSVEALFDKNETKPKNS